MKHTIKLTKLQTEKFIEFNTQIKQLEMAREQFAKFVSDAHGHELQPGDQYEQTNDLLIIDHITKSEEIKTKLKKA
jgi:hypothetical protein